jgi:hypothetical protein
MARRHRTKQREVATSHGTAPRVGSSAAPTAIRAPALPTDHFRHALLGGVAALLVARPLVPSDGGAAVGNGQVAVALWIALAALWIVQSLGRPQLRVRFGWIDAAMVAFVGWWTIAALFGMVHGSPRPSINALWEGIAILLAFLLLRQLIAPDREAGERMRTGSEHPAIVGENQSRREVPVPVLSPRGGQESRALVAVMIAVGATLAILALYQYFVTLPADRQRFIDNPAAVFRAAEIDMPAPDSPEFRRAADRFNSPEPFATFSLTNSLAAYLAPWLVITLGIALVGWRTSQAGPLGARRRWAIVGCASLIALALALTRSRSAWIGTAIGVVCLAIWRIAATSRDRASTPSPGMAASASSIRETVRPPSLGFKPLAMTLLFAIVVAGGAIAVRPHLLDPAVRSFRVRLDYWKATSAMIADRPWFGCGPGNFDDYYLQYKLPAATEEIKDPHNFAFEVAACAGLPALALLLAVLTGFALRLRRAGNGAIAGTMPETEAAPPTSDGVRWILGGALVGFWLALGWKRVVGFEAWPEEAMVGMFAAGITWWLMWPWIIRGTFPPRLCGVGVLVLLVALLAVGGITFGGVNETLWLLLAIGLNATEKRCQEPISPTSFADSSVRDLKLVPDTFSSWIVKVLLLAVVVFLFFKQLLTAYVPMLLCQSALDKARVYGARIDQTSLEHELEQLLIAAEADPYAVEPRRLLAGLRLGQWVRGFERGQRGESTSELLADFENWMTQALKLEPQSGPLQLEAGTAWRLVYVVTTLPADGRKALEFCRRAVELYPTGIAEQFELARTLSMTGDLAAAKESAREALRLDDLRPADERALSAEQRKLAERIMLGDNKAAPPPTAPRIGPPLPPRLLRRP